jgi:hypothetical protein
LGETLVFHEVLDCLDFEALATVGDGTFTKAAGAERLVTRLAQWLEGCERLLEARTGEPLVTAFWARLGPATDVVVEVIAAGHLCGIDQRGQIASHADLRHRHTGTQRV